MSFRAAAIWSLIYVVIALLFGVLLGLIAGWDLGTQFLAGYVVERSLSVDNLFVFVIILSTFAVPAEYQGRALAVGIALALVLRAIGIALIATAVQLFRHRDEDPSVGDNAVVAFARRRLPLTDRYDGSRIVTRVDGRRMLTPVFIVLIAIGTTDFLFALDSIPAVYGVTTHPYIVLAANVFALVGLRPLFFLVAGLLDRLVYLSTGLSVILTFIGAKLVLHFAHLQHHSIPEISTGASLAVVVVVLAVTTIASLARARRQPSLRAHAGSLHARHGEAARAAPGEAGRAPRGAAQATDTR